MNPTQLAAWLRAFAWVAIGAAAAWMLTRLHYTLATFGLAALLSYLLYPAVRWMHVNGAALLGRRLSWSGAVVIVFLTLPLFLAAALWISVPALTAQIDTMSQNLPHQMERLQSAVAYWQARFDNVHLPAAAREQIQGLISQSINRFADFMGNLFAHVASAVLSVFSWALYVMLAVIISNFILVTLPETRRQLYKSVPTKYRGEVQQLLYEINFVFGGFIKGTFLLSSVAALLVFGMLNGLAALAWLGVPGMMACQYALVLSLLTLVLFPIPILGLIGLLIAGAFAAYVQEGTSLAYVLTVSGIVLGAPLAVDRLVGPRLMSEAIGVSPIFVMFSAFAGAELMGFWGMILGVPVAAVVKVLSRYVWARFLSPDGDLSVAMADTLSSGASEPVILPKGTAAPDDSPTEMPVPVIEAPAPASP